MENNTNISEIARLRQRIESIERELEAGPMNSEELEFRLTMTRLLLNDYLKPLSVVEEEYRVLMQDFENGKTFDADVIRNDINGILRGN